MGWVEFLLKINKPGGWNFFFLKFSKLNAVLLTVAFMRFLKGSEYITESIQVSRARV